MGIKEKVEAVQLEVATEIENQQGQWKAKPKAKLGKQLLEAGAVLEIPPEVAVCPYCKTKLTAQFHAWTQQDDGSWTTNEADLECETEPDIDSEEWPAWFAHHSDMPYVHMLPVRLEVEAWVNEHYRFRMD